MVSLMKRLTLCVQALAVAFAGKHSSQAFLRNAIPGPLALLETSSLQSQARAMSNLLTLHANGLKRLEASAERSRHGGAEDATARSETLGRAPDYDQTLGNLFDTYHKTNYWAGSDHPSYEDETTSGGGSTIEATTRIRSCLGEWLEKYSVGLLLDIPCGDANWQRLIPGLEKVQYYGFDISPTAVETAEAKNVNMSNMQFGVLDLVSKVPDLRADLIIVKEVIFHLPSQMGRAILQHCKMAGIKWLATTTVPGATNEEISPGSWFPGPDIQASPYSMGKETESCKDAPMMLFDLEAWPGYDEI